MSPTSTTTFLGLVFAFLGFAGTISLSVFFGMQAMKPSFSIPTKNTIPQGSTYSKAYSKASTPRSRVIAFVIAVAMSQNAFVASLLMSAFEWGRSSWSVLGMSMLDFDFFQAGNAYTAHSYTPLAYLVWPALGMGAQAFLNLSRQPNRE